MATLIARNVNGTMVSPVVGSGGVYVLRESGGVRRSVLCWCVWRESGFSRREDVCIFSLHCKECCKCFKFSTFNVICKDSAAINCITVQHKNGSFP
jgi:hypothetical protein